MELPEDLRPTSPRRSKSAVQAKPTSATATALAELSPRDREMIVARIEVQWSLAEIAKRFGMTTADAARMAVTRALKKLTTS